MRRETSLSIIIIFIVSFAIYSNTLNSPFHYDDEKVIVKNESVRDIKDFQKIFSSNPSRPVSTFSFALNFWWGKLNPFSYHLVNIILHCLNGVLFFLILRITFQGDILVLVFTSLVFISHPVNTESVSYISSRSGVLCATFYLLSMIFFIIFLRNFRNTGASGLKQTGFYLTSIIFFLLSIGSKETGITLPLILILYESCFSTSIDRRGFLTPSWRDKNVPPIKMKRINVIHYKLYYVPFFVIIGAIMVLRRYFYGTLGNPTFHRDYYKNFLTQANALWAYIKLLIFPVNLNIDHEYFLSGSFLEIKTLLSFIGILILIFGALIIYRKCSEIAFSVFFFLITFSPTLLIPLQDILSERWLYLPGIGFYLFLALFIMLLQDGYRESYHFSKGGKGGLSVIGILLILFFSILTFSRNEVWSSEALLWRDAAQKSPHKARTHNNLGVALAKLKLYNEAIKSFKEAIRIDKHYSPSRANLGRAYRKKGEKSLMLQEAVALFESGNYYFKKGMIKEAIISYKELIGLVPNSVAAYGNLGMLYMSLNEMKLAKECFENVLIYNPKNEAAKKILKEINEGN